jgi:hypothetical protein
MLGIVTPPLLQMFVQSHIIAQIFNKINPYFEKNLFYFGKAVFMAKIPCQVRKTQQENCVRENGKWEKSWLR